MNLFVYALRPDGTSIWLDADVAVRLGIRRGEALTAEQMESAEVQQMLAERLPDKTGGRR